MPNFSNILTEVLKKLGKKYEELSPIAKSTYDRWEATLSGGQPITIEGLKKFWQGEKEAIIKDLASSQYELNSKEDMFLKARLNDALITLAFLESPQKAAEMLELYLKRFYKIK